MIEDFTKNHRSRLKNRFMQSDNGVTEDYELLELLLFYSIIRKDVKETAKQMLRDHGSLSNILNLEAQTLKQYENVGDNTVCLFKVVKTINNKILKDDIIDKPVISSWQSLITYLKSSMGHQSQESFRVLYLDKKNKIIKDEVESTGTIDEVSCYPREIIKKAILNGATAMILVHNHPSGDVKPSKADIELTKHINEFARMIGIRLHDHVIVSSNNYYSFKNSSIILN